MDQPQKRTLTKMEQVKRAALELFAAHGVEKVSMDEIAARANVSKMTIYKYFGGKEELHAEVVRFFIDQTLGAIEDVLNSDMDFLEKLKFILLTQVQSPQIASISDYARILESDTQTAQDIGERLEHRVKALSVRFFEEGQRQGYIDENLSFEALFLYSQVFQAGFRAKSRELEVVFAEDRHTFEQLLNLYFYSVLKRR